MKKEIFKSFIVASLIFCVHIASATEPDCALMVDELGNAAFSGDVRIKGELVRSVPIGTVLDWYRPNTSFSLPSNFAICNGATVNDPESPFHGFAVPDLVGRFIRGVGINEIGSNGGTLEVSKSFNTSLVGNHKHSLGGLVTGGISSRSGGGINGKYAMVNVDGTYISNNVHIKTDSGSGAGGPEGQHCHTITGDTGESGGHYHAVTVTLSANEKLPSYYGLLKIIRIK